jgi:NADH-quinone oxidoreductase subunit E/NADP-reducing hydrogenase subunit HndA
MSGCCDGNVERYKELQAYIDGLPDRKGRLIGVLHKAQGIFGYLPREVQEFIAGALGLPVAKVYGVVKFYSFFTMVPKGKFPISVCLGTACYVRGADDIVAEVEKVLGITVGQVTPDGLFSLDTLRCVGACGLAPVMIVAGRVYGRMKPSDVEGIIAEYRKKAGDSEKDKACEGVCCHG